MAYRVLFILMPPALIHVMNAGLKEIKACHIDGLRLKRENVLKCSEPSGRDVVAQKLEPLHKILADPNRAKPKVLSFLVNEAEVCPVCFSFALMPRGFHEFGIRAFTHTEKNAVFAQLIGRLFNAPTIKAVMDICTMSGRKGKLIIIDSDNNVMRINKAPEVIQDAGAGSY